jgi:hypothetical protein
MAIATSAFIDTWVHAATFFLGRHIRQIRQLLARGSMATTGVAFTTDIMATDSMVDQATATAEAGVTAIVAKF